MRTAAMKLATLVAIAAPFIFLFSLGTAFLLGAVHTPQPAWHRVASLSEIADGGPPLLKAVYAKRRDAWMQLPDQRVCDVYIRRNPETGEIVVFPTWHQHDLRIPIRFNGLRSQYESCCWKVRFDLDGREFGDFESRSGDLTKLPARLHDDQVWVLITD